MHERIKKLRKALGLTQQEFADQLRISRNNIATYETRKSNPGDSTISLICRIFNVNENWLRHGQGDMFIEITRDQEIAEFVGHTLSTESDTFKKRFVSMLAKLREDDWEYLEKMIDYIKEEREE